MQIVYFIVTTYDSITSNPAYWPSSSNTLSQRDVDELSRYSMHKYGSNETEQSNATTQISCIGRISDSSRSNATQKELIFHFHFFQMQTVKS